MFQPNGQWRAQNRRVGAERAHTVDCQCSVNTKADDVLAISLNGGRGSKNGNTEGDDVAQIASSLSEQNGKMMRITDFGKAKEGHFVPIGEEEAGETLVLSSDEVLEGVQAVQKGLTLPEHLKVYNILEENFSLEDLKLQFSQLNWKKARRKAGEWRAKGDTALFCIIDILVF